MLIKNDLLLGDRLLNWVLGLEDRIKFFEGAVLGFGDKEIDDACLDNTPNPNYTRQKLLSKKEDGCSTYMNTKYVFHLMF